MLSLMRGLMERRCHGGDHHLKPNTRTHTSVIDAWAKSGERGAAARAEHILNAMQSQFEEGNLDVKSNSHTYNAVMNACAFTKHEEDRILTPFFCLFALIFFPKKKKSADFLLRKFCLKGAVTLGM